MDLAKTAQLIAFHRAMLQDFDRVDRYREAIHAVVRPGDVVLDIGTGTGLLAFFACQAGARRVYAVDGGPIIALARELSLANGFGDRVVFINESSYRADLPERADVLVTETLWSFGVGEGIIGALADARNRLLTPEARVIPSSIDLFVSLVEKPGLHRTVSETPEDRHGLDFSAIRNYAVNQVLVPGVDPKELLGASGHLVSLELDASARPDFGAHIGLTADRAGVVHGLAGWFESTLARGVKLGNAPGTTSHWAQVVFPLDDPFSVEAGEEIKVRIDSIANGTAWRWVVSANGRRRDQTTMFGFPPDTTRLRRRALDARPERGRLGDALASVLSRLDGQTTTEEIARHLDAEFPDLFMQPGAAQQFAGETAEQYGDSPR